MNNKYTFNRRFGRFLFDVTTVSFCFSEMNYSDLAIINGISQFLENYKIKYVLLCLCLLVFGINWIYKNRFVVHKKSPFSYEAGCLAKVAISFFVISLVYQAINGFRSIMYTDLVLFCIPILFVYFLLDFQDQTEVYIHDAFLIYLLCWVISFFNKISIGAIFSIDISNSYSPLESGYAFYMFFFLVYFIYKKEQKNAILAIIITLLSLKRIVFYLTLLAILILYVFRKILIERATKIELKIVSKVIMITFIILPIVISALCSKTITNAISDALGIDLYYFTKGRLDRMILCINEGMKYGFGSTTEYLTKYYNGIGYRYESIYFLHSDIMRVYLETGIIGTVIFTYNFIKMGSINYYSLFLIVGLLLDMLGNHYFGAGSTFLWVVIYLSLHGIITMKESVHVNKI